MSSPRSRHLTRGHIAWIVVAALAASALAALLWHRWYTSDEQVLQRNLDEIAALPGVATADAHGESAWHPQLAVTLEDDVTAGEIGDVAVFAEQNDYLRMSATLDHAELDPSGGWPSADAIDVFLYTTDLDLPAATPGTRTTRRGAIELLYPDGTEPLTAVREAAVYAAGLADAPETVTMFDVRPDGPSGRHLMLDRDVLQQEPDVVQAVLETLEPLAENLHSLDVDPGDTLVELYLEHEPTDDEKLAYREEVSRIMAALPDRVDLPEDYRVRVSVGYVDQVGDDYFQAYPDQT